MAVNPDDAVIPSTSAPTPADLASAVDAVLGIDDPQTLRVLEAVTRETLANLRLRVEREWLERRIAEEDARLAHA